MNIITNHNKLLTALKHAERFVAKNITLPILGTILLRAEKGNLILSATNLEIGINYKIGAKIEKEGLIAVPARVLSDFISAVNDEKITLKSEKQILYIQSEHYKTQILGMKTDEFPIIPIFSSESKIEIPSHVLRSKLSAVFDATSVSEIRPELSGVYVHVAKSGIDFAATDSFRLSEASSLINGNDMPPFIIPRNAVMEMIRLTEESEALITVMTTENQLLMKGEDFELVSRLIDGRYPDYKRVIPEIYTSSLTVNKSELERHIRMASVFSSSIADLKLKASNNTLTVMAKNSERGEITSSLPGQLKNSGFETTVNYRYLLDGLKTISSSNVHIHFTGVGAPLVLKGEGMNDQTYVIMPLRSS